MMSLMWLSSSATSLFLVVIAFWSCIEQPWTKNEWSTSLGASLWYSKNISLPADRSCTNHWRSHLFFHSTRKLLHIQSPGTNLCMTLATNVPPLRHYCHESTQAGIRWKVMEVEIVYDLKYFGSVLLYLNRIGGPLLCQPCKLVFDGFLTQSHGRC